MGNIQNAWNILHRNEQEMFSETYNHSLVDDLKADTGRKELWENYCRETRRPKNVKYTFYGKWQITKRSKDSIIAYSAFYDSRPAIGKLPVIQILTVSTTTVNLFCHVWFEGKISPYVTRAQTRASGAPYYFFGQTYGQYYFTCVLPGIKQVPTQVTIAGSECGLSTILLPVIYSQKSKWKVEFGICVPISYGNIPRSRFIEWMEMNLLLGVEEIHVYNGTVTKSVIEIFGMYVKEKKLFIHEMPPAVKSWTQKGAELGSPASLNDCMLRYMYRYRYIVVVDFDEVIMPRKATNYHDMLTHINKEHRLKEDLPVYSFSNTYFLFDFSPDEAEQEHMTYLRYRNRAQPGAIGLGKSFVDPRRCLSVFNHYCYVPFPGMENGEYFNVKSSVAISQHYKTCNLSKDQCALLKKQKTQDDIMLKFKSKLVENINKRRKSLKLSGNSSSN